MRVDQVDTGEIRHSIDEQWFYLLQSLGFVVFPLSSQMPLELVFDVYGLDGLVLSGGNDVTKDGSSFNVKRNRFELALLKKFEQRRLPVLGVCRGMQLMNIYFDGDVCGVVNHVAKDHVVEMDGEILTVNSFHNFGITKDTLGKSLMPIAYAHDSSIEAFKHSSLPWLGIMWHPERVIENSALHAKLIAELFEGEKHV